MTQAPCEKELRRRQKPLVRAQPDIAYTWEPYGVVYKQMAPYLRAYWEENEPHPNIAPYDPDFDLYFNLERDGKLGVFCASQDGLILGFNSFLIATTLARRSVITAVADILYIRPAARGGPIARSLILDAEPGLKARGALFARYTPSSAAHLGVLLERCGYAKKGGDYEKVIGDV